MVTVGPLIRKEGQSFSPQTAMAPTDRTLRTARTAGALVVFTTVCLALTVAIADPWPLTAATWATVAALLYLACGRFLAQIILFRVFRVPPAEEESAACQGSDAAFRGRPQPADMRPSLRDRGQETDLTSSRGSHAASRASASSGSGSLPVERRNSRTADQVPT